MVRNGLVLSVGGKAKSFDETDCPLGMEDFWSAVQSSLLMHTLFDISIFCLNTKLLDWGPFDM